MTQPVTIVVGQPILASDFDAYENITAVWPTWLPVLGNLTLGNGTMAAKYRHAGKTVDYRLKITLGTTSVVGTNPNFTLPVTPHADWFADDQIGFANLLDWVTQLYTGVAIYNGGGVARFKVGNASSTYVTTTDVTATVPFTFGNLDVLTAWGTYYAA